MLKKITCGKFDNNINFNIKYMDNKKIRIGSKNPNKLEKYTYYPIATDGNIIIFKDNYYEVRDFFIKTDVKILKKLMVLTVKERNLILDTSVDFGLDVSVFEMIYPIFNHIRYISNIHKNYEELHKLMKEVVKLKIYSKSLAHQLSNEYLYKIERTLRFKNKLDSFFAFSYRGGYQEVFKLKEERLDRSIIALDFNSMYVSCMMDKFIEPKSIKYQNFTNTNTDINLLENGLYRVILKKVKNTFFKKFHPFKYTKLNHSFYFELEDNQEIELLLFKNEINYYKKFFENIEIKEGFYSKKTIDHPLKKYANKVYKDRLKYKEENNQMMNNLCKYQLITIHSATNQKRFKILYFKTIKSIISYISDMYMINFNNSETDIEKLEGLQDNNYFSFWRYKKGYKIKVIDFTTYESIYSISAQIIANSRMKMIQTIEKFLSYNSVEICYANIDSLHLSILKTEVDNFLLKNKNIISNKLGDLKIESIADKGYWFDVGRYWLFNSDKVDIFKNSLFNFKNENNKFIKNKKLNIICHHGMFDYVKGVWISIYKSFSYHKKINYDDYTLDKCNFKRYNFSEIENLLVANDSYSQETLKSKKIKMDLINKIATV